MKAFDVVIVGGGAVGASLALALRTSDVSVAWVSSERASGSDVATWDSRIYALTPGNARWLDEMGVWQKMPEARVTAVESMRIFGDKPSGHLEFDAYDAGLRELAFIIENRAFVAALWEALADAEHVDAFHPATCASMRWEREHACVTLATARSSRARLVVGADGGDSWVRRQAGIAVSAHEYDQIGVVANYECERPHDGTAFQWFRADGVLALLPLAGNRTSMVWSTGTHHAHELMALDADELCRVVEDASGRALGRCGSSRLPPDFH